MKVTKDKLLELATAARKAREEYHGHSLRNANCSIDAQVEFDLAEDRLMRACRKAEDAYAEARKSWLAQSDEPEASA